MKRFSTALLFCAAAASAQITVSRNDAAPISANQRTGVALSQPSPSDPLRKNLLCYSNCGFEPLQGKQIYQFQGTSSFSSPTQFQWNVNNVNFNAYDANQWANATFLVTRGSYAQGNSDPALNCTGTIASSTEVSGQGPQFVINSSTNQGSSGCAGSLGVAGQQIIVTTNNTMANVYPTPSALWTTSAGGNNGSVFTFGLSSGATVTSNTTDLCGTCGTQSLALSIPSGGHVTMTASSQLAGPAQKSMLLNGAYTISFMVKGASANVPTLSLSVTPRNGTAGCTALGSTPTAWGQISTTCTFNEHPSADNFNFAVQITITATGGATNTLYFDNISMTRNADSNPTQFNDFYVKALSDLCQATQNTTGPGCTLRAYPPSPGGETMANWVLPVFQHRPEITNFGPYSNAYSQVPITLPEFFGLCQYLNAVPLLNIPITMGPADIANLVDYLQGGAGTAFGAIRIAAGQTVPWVGASNSPFPVIYIEDGNENWNPGFLGNALGANSSAPTNGLYYDYEQWAKVQFAAARAEQTTLGLNSAQIATTQWIVGVQTASGGDGGMAGIALADGVELNGYTAGNIGNVSTTGCTGVGASTPGCPFYGPTLTEPWSNTHDSTTGFRQVLTNIQGEHSPGCGPSGTATCKVMVYEQNTGTYASTVVPFNQAATDAFTPAYFQAIVAVEQQGENDAAGVVNQNQFQASQYYFQEGNPNTVNVPMWGQYIDTGGDCSVTNAASYGGSYCPRPQFLGTEIYNWCKIGSLVPTTWTNNPTYNLAANSNGVNAINNVPYLKGYSFSSGTTDCMVIVNSDIANSYTVNFIGTHAPSTGVTTYQLAGYALSAANEEPDLENTSLFITPINAVLTPGVNVSSGYVIPALSVTALLWTIGGAAPPRAIGPFHR